MYILLVYAVKMVITSPEIFHSLLFSDYNIAIRDNISKLDIKGPFLWGGASFFFP